MNWSSWLVWGFASTIVLTTLMAGSQSIGMTRMNIPYMLGTVFTPSRDRAKVVGALVHVVNGLLFSFVYVATFHAWGGPSWWKGALIGFVQAGFVLVVGMPALPGMHPRMASERRGPTIVRQLEPPGFLALHYGVATPVSVVLAHVAFGVILGVFYAP
jgi:uncharacterized membrane protein YagU involved in acid resistance